ncbi:MAG: hypothetical protein L0Y35_09635 [Flammeovirgaceae bacterium]|nr:hypothetical protein [Flammeovirgaceae bacterium]
MRRVENSLASALQRSKDITGICLINPTDPDGSGALHLMNFEDLKS